MVEEWLVLARKDTKKNEKTKEIVSNYYVDV